MNLTNLRIDYSNNPYGIDREQPSFSWEIVSDENDVFQDWYHVQVSENRDFSELMWDTGKVVSRDTFGVVYQGRPLKADTKYYYSVTCCVNGSVCRSEVMHFITGTFGNPIQGAWISPQQNNYKEAETCPMIRGIFDVDTGGIDYVTLQIYAFGFYEVYLNGKRPDDRILAPAHSNTRSVVRYDVYDITDLILQGKNVVALLLGDGFNETRLVNWTGRKRMIAAINVHYSDGAVKTFTSDDSWKYCYDSPVLSNSLYDGESYDATREKDGWMTPEFDDSTWNQVYAAEDAGDVMWKAWTAPRVRVIETREVVEVYECGDGRYILDFGQNMAGFVHFKLSAPRGTKLRMRHAEEIRKGEVVSLDTFTNRYAKATDTYIFKGEGVEEYQPRFTYHGFRYVEVTGVSHRPEQGEFVACVIHGDFEGASEFRTNCELLNRMHDNALWSFKSNNLTYPSDCPVRDERTDCAMDFYNAVPLSLYLYDIASYCESWIGARKSSYKDDGTEMLTWSGVLFTLAWDLYICYGDVHFLEENYEWLKYIVEKRYIEKYPDMEVVKCFGDWCVPHIPGDYKGSESSALEVEYYMAVKVFEALANMAEKLGIAEDYERYREFVDIAKNKYNEKFFDAENKTYSGGKQTPNLMAIYGDIVPQIDRSLVERQLLSSIQKNNELDVGIFGARLFMECLDDVGTIDTALDCFMRDEYPSFKYQIDRGATTTWEQWIERGDMDSHNHQMFGGAMAAFYSRLAGITPMEPGYRKICIKPRLSKHVKQLHASVKTVCGRVNVDWEHVDGVFQLSVHIPANCEAEIVLPDGSVHKVSNGTYHYRNN